ncbi:YycH family regulatory protein [Peribacillus sp. SCS-155]|uniref:YycH family regulatory protein n=1 Tax=Peribacillus sedimenti TaxID=3115297 RepID=UPI0039066DBC
MNLEGAKNIILTALVVISAFLTWNIWTYQPHLKKIDNNDDLLSVESEQQSVSKIIKPTIVQINKLDTHYRINGEENLNKVQSYYKNWSFHDFKDISHSIGSKDFDSLLHENGDIEILFPDAIPLSLYKSVIDINDKEVPKFSFDRIIVKTKFSTDGARVHFVNYDKKKIYECRIDASNLSTFKNQFFNNTGNFPEYMAVKLDNGKEIFLPKQPVKMKSYKYLIKDIDLSKFKNGLFSNPNLVRHNPVPEGDQFLDEERIMTVNIEASTILFVNPAQKSKFSVNKDSLIPKSIDFIGNHAGWDGNYVFSEMNEEKQRVVFRLFLGGFPVFSDLGMSQMEQVWGDEDIYSYQRPSVSLNIELPADGKEVTMSSGEEILQKLENINKLNQQDLEDIQIGYTMTKDPTQPKWVVVLEPAWYYRYGGTWVAFPVKKLGGAQSGLE